MSKGCTALKTVVSLKTCRVLLSNGLKNGRDPKVTTNSAIKGVNDGSEGVARQEGKKNRRQSHICGNGIVSLRTVNLKNLKSVESVRAVSVLLDGLIEIVSGMKMYIIPGQAQSRRTKRKKGSQDEEKLVERQYGLDQI